MQEPVARRFLCALCRAPVLVCSHCDRGQRYCAGPCSAISRRAAQQEAGRRYQSSRAGRFNHAARTQRWRTRQASKTQSVTHQGSQETPLDAVLAAHAPAGLATTATKQTDQPCTTIAPQPCQACVLPLGSTTNPAQVQCHWCCTTCAQHVRLGFLRRAPAGTDHGHLRRTARANPALPPR
jgi:hypothetical protein